MFGFNPSFLKVLMCALNPWHFPMPRCLQKSQKIVSTDTSPVFDPSDGMQSRVKNMFETFFPNRTK